MTNELRKVIRYYHKLEAAWLSPVKNSDDYLAATCLFEYLSYRLLESDKNDPLLGFRVFFRTLKRILRPGSEGLVKFHSGGEALVISGTLAIQERVNEYVQRSGHITLNSYVAKDIVTLAETGKFKVVLSLLPFALRQSLRCVFGKYRLAAALSIAEVTEIAFVLDYTKKNNIRKVYDFVPYEIDSNFMYQVLRENGLEVVKIPSSGPLATHHKILLSDEVVFSTPYHFEEYNTFKDSFRIKKISLWPPERAYQYYPRYKTDWPQPQKKTLGFYSHGEWLRKAEKHSGYGGRIGEAEETILYYLGRYVKEHPDFRLIIFPHPRELRTDLLDRMKAFYNGSIGHDHYEIAQYEGGTTQHFEKVDIAVAAFSTILYERLYCGYKTLIGNMAISEFPMNKSTLNNICFRTYDSMSRMIDEYSGRNEDYFYTSTSLESFRAVHYPEP